MLIGFVALLPVGPEFAGAATNRRTAKDANIAKRFDPWVYRRFAFERGWVGP